MRRQIVSIRIKEASSDAPIASIRICFKDCAARLNCEISRNIYPDRKGKWRLVNRNERDTNFSDGITVAILDVGSRGDVQLQTGKQGRRNNGLFGSRRRNCYLICGVKGSHPDCVTQNICFGANNVDSVLEDPIRSSVLVSRGAINPHNLLPTRDILKQEAPRAITTDRDAANLESSIRQRVPVELKYLPGDGRHALWSVQRWKLAKVGLERIYLDC